MKSSVSSGTIVVTLLLAATFILSHPYVGIRHDGILYLGEALVDLEPGRMSDDLFFLFGSQASFSVVPHLYAACIGWLGIGNATMLLLACSLTAYFCASIWVVRRLTTSTLQAWSLFTLFVGAPVYGGHKVFAYGEVFFTARSLAEPLVLIGIGLLLRGRRLFAVVLMVVALFVHPLLALPGLLLCWLWLVIEDRRWLWAAALGLAPIGLGLAGIAPFADLFRRYDPEWMAVVQDNNAFVFPLNWMPGDWGTVVFDVVVLGWWVWLGRARATPTSKLALATLLCGLVGIGGAIVGADLLDNVLVTGLQVWRAHWLMHWMAMALAPALFLHLWRCESANARSAALCIVASIFCLTSFGPIFFMVGAVLLFAYQRRVPVSRTIVIAFGLLCVALATVLAVRQVAALTAFIGLLGGAIPVQVSRPLSITLVTMLLVVAGLRWLPRLHARGIALMVFVCGFVALGWDQREEWTVFQENYSAERPLLWNDVVRDGDRVFWYREVRAPWLMMHHANYFSPNQGSGVLFNRRTALELSSRSSMTSILDMQETVCRLMNNLNKNATACEPDIEVVRDICTSADHLSFIVLQTILSVAPAGTLRTGFIRNGYESVFYLYRCRDIAQVEARTPRQ